MTCECDTGDDYEDGSDVGMLCVTRACLLLLSVIIRRVAYTFRRMRNALGGVLVPISNACVSGASRSVVPMMHLSRLAGAVKTWIAGIQFYPTMLASYRQAVRAILQLRWLTRPWPCSSERCQRDGAGVKYAGAHVRSSRGSEGFHSPMQTEQMGRSRCEVDTELWVEECPLLKRPYTEM